VRKSLILIGFVIVTGLLLAGFTGMDSLRVQRALLAASAADLPDLCDYAFYTDKYPVANLYRRAIHIPTLAVWDPTAEAWTRDIAWADSLAEVSYDELTNFHYDKFSFGTALGGEIYILYFPSQVEGAFCESDITIYWDRHAQEVAEWSSDGTLRKNF